MQNIIPTPIEVIMKNPAIQNLISDVQGRAAFIEAASRLFHQPAYANCTNESLLGCLLKAATFGFTLSPELGECYAIPRSIKTGQTFKNATGKDVPVMEIVAVFQIGYKGWKSLAERTGRVKFWDYAAVYSNDLFEFEMGSDQYIRHQRSLDDKNRGTRTAFWAMANLGPEKVFAIMSIAEAEEYRRSSETQFAWVNGQKQFSAEPTGIWGKHYNAMAMRKLFKELATKKIPLTDLTMQAVNADDSVTNVNEKGVIIEVGASEVAQMATEETMHEDYELMVNNCKTREDIRSLYDAYSSEMDPKVKAAFLQACKNRAQTITK